MASITMDIQARVVGYEQSLKTLQTALAKLDPGSDLGKSLTKALDQAKNQVAALSKNLFPKASSDTQVDAIIEKVNRAGEAVQHVAQLMQGLNTTDFNFSALGAGITDLQKQITSLESDMSSKLNNGLVSAIQNSKDLSELFAKLNIDLSQATTGSIFETLASEASKAQDEVSKAEAEVRKAQNAITNNAKSQQIQTAKIFGTEDSKNNIKQQVEEVQAQYDTAIGALKERVTNGLATLLQGTSGIDQTKLVDNFFKDLTPENIKDKINALFTSLESSGLETTKRDFYEKLFGGGTNINQVVRNLNFEGLTEEYKNKLSTIFEAIKNDLSAKDSNKITTLISQNNIQGALENTLSSIEKAYERIQQKIKELQNKVVETLNPNLQAANLHRDSAIANQQAIDSANTTLQGEINTLKSQLSDQAQEIAKLKEQLQTQTNSAVKQVKQSASTAGAGATAQMFPRSEAAAYKVELEQVAAKEQMLGKVQGVVQRWFSIYAAIRMVNNAIKSVISTVKELDTTITNIAIVTNMSQGDLWAQMPKYTAMARQYAASISGVYQVSQLYYQQGLQQNDVMALTEQTLKMARISGLDYADATNYMTNAVRSFKMEMTDAQTVVDVYSSIAASSATSVSELASAMSKTASSAQAVGASFENTTAMMAVMIEATRESAENIGSAMKSIISRYGEMKSDPSKLVDSEGQEMSLNKVDKALQTVGISIKDVNGEFRNFDDVIMELAKNWDTIDKNTQRYIATVMAGNRQQSRFLALVSSYDRLKELSEEAADSENASQLQYLKTLDSIDAKTQQLQTSIQSLYTSSGVETAYKGVLDWANQLVTTLDQLEEKSGLTVVVGKIGAAFTTLATLVTTIFSRIKAHYSNMKTSMLNTAKRDAALEQQRIANEELETIESEYRKTGVVEEQAYERAKAKKRESDQAVQAIAQEERAYIKLQNKMSKQSKLSTGGMIASSLGMVGTTLAASIDVSKNPDQRGLKAGLTGVSAGLSGLGTGLMVGATAGGPIGALIGGLTALPGIIEAIGMGSESAAEKIATLENNIKEASNASIQSKSELKTLEEYKNKYDELSKAQYESTEKKEEFIKVQNEIAANYPELIANMDAEGNYLVDMVDGYNQLAEAKRNAYRSDIISQAGAELAGLSNINYVLKNIYGQNPVESAKTVIGYSTDKYKELGEIDYFQDQSIYGDQVRQLLNNYSGQQAGTFDRLFKNSQAYTSLVEPVKGELGDINSQSIIENLTQIYLDIMDYVDQDISPEAALNKVKEKWQHTQDDLIDSFDLDLFNQARNINRASTYQVQLIRNKMSTYSSEMINLLSDSVESAWDITSSGIQKRFIKEQMLDDWTTFYQDNISRVGRDWNEETQAYYTYNDLIEEFYSQREEFWYKQQLESEALKGITADQEKFYENLGQHTISEVKEMFPEVSQEEMDTMSEKDRILAEAQNERAAFIRKIYGLDENWELDVETNSDIGKILKDYNNWLNSEDVSKFNISNYGDKIGPEFLGKIQELYQTIIANSSLGEKQIQSQINALNSINNYITSDAFTSDQRNTLLGKIASADLTSVYGIYDLIETINSLELDDANKNNLIASLKQLSNALSANIQSEIDSYIDTIEKNSTDFTKAVSSATGGMDIKTATEMAAKLGVTLNDFEVIGGKFYFNDLEKLRQAYLKENQEYEQALRDNVEKRYSDFEKIAQIKIIDNEGEENDIFEELSGTKILNGEYSVEDLQSILKSDAAQVDFQQITGVSYTDFIKYYTEFQEQIETGTSDFVEFMLLKVDSYLDESGKNLMAYLQQNAATSLLKAGDTEGFMKSIGVYKPENIEDYTLSAEELAQAKVEAQAQVDEAIASNQKNIQDKVETYREQAVETLRGVSQADVDTKASELLHADVDKNNAILDSQEKIKELSEYQSDAIQEFLDNGLVSEEDLQKEIERLEADYDTRLAKAGYQEIDDEKIQAQAEQDYLADFEERKKKYYEARKQWGYTPEAADEQFGAYEDTEEYKQQWIQERTNALANEIEMANEAIINSFEDSDIVIKDQALENLGAIGTYDAAEVNARAQELLDDAIARNNAKLKELIKTDSKDYATLAIEALNGNADYTEEELQAKMEELAKQDLIDSGEWLSEELESYQPEVISEEVAAAQAKEAATLNQRIENAINTANIKELAAIDKEFGTNLMSFSKLIYDQYHNVRSSIVSAMTNAIGGKTKYFEVTDANKEQLEELQQLHPDWITGEVKVGQYVTISAEQLALDADAYMQYIAASFDTVDEQIKALSEYHKNKYANNSTSSLSSVIEKATFSYNDLLNYLVNNHNVDLEGLDESTLQTYMSSMGLAFNSVGDVIVEDYERWIADLQWAADNLSSDASTAEINAAKARLAEAKTKQAADQKSAISDIVGNYNAVTEKQKETLANSLNIDIDDLAQYFTSNGDGTSILDVTKFKQDIKDGTLKVEDGVAELLNEIFANVADNYTKNVQTAISLVTKGTTNQKDIEAFKTVYRNTMGQELSDNAFQYDSILDAWTLDPAVLKSFVTKQAEELKAQLDLNEDEVNQWIEGQTTKILATNVDISSFLSAEDKTSSGKAYKQLMEQMKQYYQNSGNPASLAETIAKNNIGALKQGGIAAVKVVQDWAESQDREATAEEIEQAFNSAINDLNDAMDQLTDLTVGQITTGKLREYLASVGKVDENGVVTSVSDMVDVYQAIYDDMKNTAGKTTAGLNAAYAKVLTAGDQKDIDTLEALENASDMTYDALGELLAKYNIELEEFMGHTNNGITKAGFGKIKIVDWDTFAKAVGLSEIDMNTPEYMEAYSKWVDSRVEFENNEKQRVEDAISELKGLTEAKADEAINISHLETVIGDGLSELVSKYGATLINGVLTISDNTNILELIQAITNEASNAGKLIPEQLVELNDAIQDMLSSIVSLLQGGIKGNLSNSQANSLQQLVKQYDSNLKLDFSRTKDGLKLSEQSAKDLYEILKQIDSLSAQIVLDELNESIEESVTNTKRLQGEIAQLRTTAESDDFKFMDHDIPGGQNNPLNYFENWTKAFKALEDAGKGKGADKGKMAYQDFYNMITEMGNLAETTGQMIPFGNETVANAEQAAALIEKGAGYLSVAADGTLKVDLTKLGVDFVTGAKDMKQNVGKGIQEVARSQIEMLNSMIQLLETIVAMEDLGDLADEGGDKNKIEISDILPDIDFNAEGQAVSIGEFSEAYTKWKDSIIKQITGDAETNKDFNKDLADAAKNIKIDDISFETILGFSPEELAGKGEDFLTKYSAVLDAMWKAAQSGDYNLDNIIGSIKEVLAGTGFEGEIQIGDQTLVFSQGQTLIKLKDGTYKGEHTENSYATAEEAAAKEALVVAGVKEGEIEGEKDESGNIKYKGSLKIDETEFEVTLDENNKPIYTSKDGQSFNSQFEAAQYAYEKYKESAQTDEKIESYADWSVRVFGKLVTGTVEITNEADFQARTHEQVQEIAKALASGDDQSVVDAAEKVGIKVELTDGKLLEEQRQQLTSMLNIEDKTIVVDLQGEQAQTDAETLMTTLTDLTSEPYAVTIDSTSIDTVSSKIEELKTQLATLNQSDTPTQPQGKIKIKDQLDETEKLNQKKVKVQADTTEAEGKLTKFRRLAEDAVDAIKDKKLTIKSDTKEAVDSITEINDLINDLVTLIANIEVVIKQDVMTNDITKAQLDSINELLTNIRNQPEAEIRVKMSSDSDAKEKLDLIIQTLKELDEMHPIVDVDVDPEGNVLGAQIPPIVEAINNLDALSPVVDVNVNDQASGVIAGIQAAINALSGKTITVTTNYVTTGSPPRLGGSGHAIAATGNVGVAQAQGTLMGELGPELVVSKGRYFVAGQSGAEFVNLDNDAIVFNHLQTEQLLKNGMSNQRGKAVTNERNAVAFAQGNINGGPAMASAKAALAALKQLRAQWQAIVGMNAKDMAGLGGSGNGGGGGGDKKSDPKAFVKQLEIWYNWLQRIAVLEEKINYEEAKRNELASNFNPNGKTYVKSQKETLDYLKEEVAIQESLVESQQTYFDQRRAQMNSANNPFSALYTFDEYGQLKYKNGALEELSNLIGRDSLTGQANMTAEEQYKRLVSMGYGKYMEYDNSGNPIDKEQDDWYVSAVQAFWDKIDADQEEMQSLHDSIEEHKKAVLEKQDEMNQILHEIEDNQIEVENKVLNAYVETRQRAIDELQKERDAIEESSQALIDGLSTQLQKERDMYERQQDTSELSSLQRQLNILQRSGGSASQIASLQKEISQKQQDAYFDAQQQQIDALQEASDNQLERLDKQIELMTEQLEYEKTYGLLWNEVNQILSGTPEEIASYIQKNTESYWGTSPTELAKNIREDLFAAQKYVGATEEWGNINKAALAYYEQIEAEKKKLQEEEEKKKAAAAEKAKASALSSSSSGGSGSSGGSEDTSPSTNSGKKEKNSRYVSDGASGHHLEITYTDGSVSKGSIQSHEWPGGVLANGSKCTKCGFQTSHYTPGSSTPSTNTTKGTSASNSETVKKTTTTSNFFTSVSNTLKNSIATLLSKNKKAGGGYVGHGIYELGEQGTETVLTAEQTQVLRNNILSNRPNSLISLLKSYNEAYDGIGNAATGASQVEDNSVVIERIEMNMNVSKIANDYDAQRAGEQALDKMLQIARKTQGQNRIGR